jgi:hypothetical protein
MRVPSSRRLRFLLALVLLAGTQALFAFDTTLVPSGSTWKYLANGSNQGTAWRAATFDDSAWLSGPAQFGYGDGDEATVVSYGPDPDNKYVTTYFRKTFNVPNPASFNSLNLSVLRDDGAVVFLNGVEVWRNNMPATWGYQTLASADAGTTESTFIAAAVDVNRLVSGQNVLAVEIHQNHPASSDISFDLRLVGSTNAPTTQLVRGPYLQMGTPTSLRVRWRTDLATDSRVRYGASPASLTNITDVAGNVTDHEVLLTGLAPATRYYYSVGSSTQVVAGGDPPHSFVTAPLVGTVQPTRVWILGDSGTANNDARAVRDAYLGFTGSTYTNLWLMLGDNAYTYGSDEDYQWAVFDMYPMMLRQSVLWPTIGNHDTAEVPVAPPDLPYFAMFSLPTAGEAGGVPSGTEKYYSFDYANIHFICLDSMVSDRSPTGPMLTWLQSDLQSTTQPWIIAFWHHPPYSKGSHDSDVDIELIEMRQNALPILEAYGVDLVLSGHSHSYERSYLLDSHYGFSTSLISSMKKDAGDGRPAGTGAYQKTSPGTAPHEGAVYVVAGSSGLVQAGPMNHPAMFIGLTNLGSMVLDVNGNRLDAKFVRENGAVADSFTIIKGAVTAPSALSATAISATRIDLQWTDNSGNEDGFRVERCTGSAAACDAAPAGFAFLDNTTAATYSDTTAAASTTYSYRVRAFNSAAVSTYTNTAEATTPAAPVAPAAPSGLTATATSTTNVTVAWTDNATNEDGFHIERCTGTMAACDASPASFAQVAQLAADTTSWPDTGRTPGATYTYRVRAFNGVGNSAYSGSAQVIMPAPPTAPTALAATAISTTQINLTWTDTATNEDGFRVERCTGTAATCDASPASYAQVAQLAADATSWPDTGRSAGTTYTYRVRAFNTWGQSAYSNGASATTPAPPTAPTTLAATAISTTQINLTWTDTATNEDNVRVERCTGTAAACASGTFTQIALLGANATSYGDSGLAPSTTYSYRVIATNTSGESAPSNIAAATTATPCTAPSITTHPQSSEIASGNSTTLSVTATGTQPLAYQWYTGASGNTSAPVSGGTNASITVSPVATTSYWVRVTNACGTANSNAATVTVAPVVPTARDFDRDGKADIFWRSTATASNYVWFMNGSTFTPAVASAAPQPWVPTVLADFSGDGKADVLWRNPNTGETSIWLMNGGTFSTAVRSITLSDLNWTPAGSGDFNGDGYADILWRNGATGQNTLWQMNGTSATPLGVPTVPVTWEVSVTADFNGDGKTDVFWRNVTTGETSIWLMNGATYTVAARSMTVPDVEWRPVAAGDFDADGKADLFWRRSSGPTSVWLMNGTAIRSTHVGLNVPATWAIRGTGDYNADRKTDLFWWNSSTGETSAWLMNGPNPAVTARTQTVGDTSIQPILGK